MSYNQIALTRVGNLRIIYNRKGQIVNIVGNVKCFGNFSDCDDNFGTTFESDGAQSHNNLYYRKNGTAKESDTK